MSRAILLLLLLARPGLAQVDPALERRGLEGLKPVPLELIPDGRVSALGADALSVRTPEWKHATTDHFILHYFSGHVASPVAVEAEFYWRVFVKELRLESPPPGPRAHIFLFDRPEHWRQFQTRATLEPWTGGIHSKNELLLLRDGAARFKNHALGHEIVHLLLDRLHPAGLPLWAEEGLAELLAIRAHAAFHRARGYLAKPRAPALPAGGHLPLRTLFGLQRYPTAPGEVDRFYDQSHLLVRFLWGEDPQRFLEFLAKLGRQAQVETALIGSYGASFPTIDALERAFVASLPRTPPAASPDPVLQLPKP